MPLPATRRVHVPACGRLTITTCCARKLGSSVASSPTASAPDGRTTSAVCRHWTEIEKSTLSTDESIGTSNSCSPVVTEPASLKIVCGCAPSAVSSVAESPISSGASSSRCPPVPSATRKYDESMRAPHGHAAGELERCCCAPATSCARNTIAAAVGVARVTRYVFSQSIFARRPFLSSTQLTCGRKSLSVVLVTPPYPVRVDSRPSSFFSHTIGPYPGDI